MGRPDQGDFEARFDELYDLSMRFASRFFGESQNAQDAAQEALTRLWSRWSKLADHPNLAGWTTEATRRVCLEMVRKRRARHLFTADVVPALELDVIAAPLAHALDGISERQRLVVMARYYFDYSVAETAALLDLTDSKVKDATHEAVVNLRRHPALLGLREP